MEVIFQTRVMCFGSFLPLEWEVWRLGELVKRVFAAGIDEVFQCRFLNAVMVITNVTPRRLPTL